ncbi:helix-turn-helix domain-containing protein [Anaerofustis stercorihominis]|uniref:helix-turn-helix domain-containing protein n=1 Tax=Anaerofustis stercorihominis TaxID=214853 RepID=UPI00214B608C|nr:helix-turn-helix transcriptional regulator [Anaerofustis stercorihominis]MCR2031939.1 helix-turn-helix domain-containing protein [Anaerofustis stercorihominis]
MDIDECVKIRINNLIKERGLSENQLAKKSSLSYSTLKNILNDTTGNPGIKTIRKICNGFEMDILDFFAGEEFESIRYKKER